ncbi:MAG: hypothetical protein KGM44_07565 [bacterium]|nr:hypothetical protein [bacterium]
MLAGFAPACLGLIAFAAGFAYCAAQWGLLGGTLLALALTLLALETLRRLLHRTAVTRAESAA